MGEHPGLSVSRTDAIVMLLTEALNARGVVAPTEEKSAPVGKKAATRKARRPQVQARKERGPRVP